MKLLYSEDTISRSAEVKTKIGINKQPIVGLVQVLKDYLIELRLKLNVESNLDKTQKIIVINGDSHVSSLENNFWNGYYETETTSMDYVDWGLRVGKLGLTHTIYRDSHIL